MRRFRKWFAQIMINKLLKNELDQLKITIAGEIDASVSRTTCLARLQEGKRVLSQLFLAIYFLGETNHARLKNQGLGRQSGQRVKFRPPETSILLETCERLATLALVQ